MPRYWFISKDDVRLIQVQKDAFIFNWRRRHAEYPRYHKNIKPAFDRYYELFERFVRAETDTPDLRIGLCELTYVNALEHGELWTGPGDTKKIMSSFSLPVPGIQGTDPPDFSCNYAYRVPPDMQINVLVRTAVKDKDPQGSPVLVFEIRASGRLDRVVKPAADEWFERAHEKVNECFRGITNREVQDAVWQPLEEEE